jgi:Replication-relaxation
MNTRLRILLEQEYIGRRYDDTYKRRIQFASYFLLQKGIEVLKQRPDNFRYQVLRNIRKDVNASERFVQHSLNVFGVYCSFKEPYGDSFKFFTKSYINKDYFPKPLPDAYVSFKQEEGEQLRHFMLECFDGTMPDFAMRQRVEQYVAHADSGEWTEKASYPEILLVCATEALQKKARKWATKALDDGWADDLVITATTKDKLAVAVETS